MNSNEFNKGDLSAWRDMLNLQDSKFLSVALLYLISGFILPVLDIHSREGFPLMLAFIVICISLACIYFVTRTFRSVLTVMLALFILYGFTGNAPLTAAFVALFFAISSGAVLLAAGSKKQLIYAPALPILAYALALSVKHDFLLSLLVLLPLPAAVIAALALRRLAPHTGAVTAVAVTLGGTLAVCLAVAVALSGLWGAGFVDNLRAALTETLRNTVREINSLYAQVSGEAGVAVALSNTDIENIITLFLNLSPAIFSVASLILAFFAWRTTLYLLVHLTGLPRLPLRLSLFTVSPVAAGLFIIAFLFSLFGNMSSVTFIGTLGQNISLILAPGLAFIGVGLLSGRGAQPSCLSQILLIGLIFLFLTNTMAALMLASFFGAVNILAAQFFKKHDKGEP